VYKAKYTNLIETWYSDLLGGGQDDVFTTTAHRSDLCRCCIHFQTFSQLLIISTVNSTPLAMINVCSAVGTGPVFVKFSTVGMLLGVLAEVTEPSQTIPAVDTTALGMLPESL